MLGWNLHGVARPASSFQSLKAFATPVWPKTSVLAKNLSISRGGSIYIYIYIGFMQPQPICDGDFQPARRVQPGLCCCPTEHYAKIVWWKKSCCKLPNGIFQEAPPRVQSMYQTKEPLKHGGGCLVWRTLKTLQSGLKRFFAVDAARLPFLSLWCPFAIRNLVCGENPLMGLFKEN